MVIRSGIIQRGEADARLLDWLKCGYGQLFVDCPALLKGLGYPNPTYTSRRIAEQMATWQHEHCA